jgi:hypothetical protein
VGEEEEALEPAEEPEAEEPVEGAEAMEDAVPTVE